MRIQKFRILIAIAIIAAVSIVIASYRSGGDRILAMGEFHSVSHRGRGSVVVVRMPNGSRAIRISNFRTYHRPGLTLLLIDASDAFENETVKQAEKFVVGDLKADEGSMEYPLPDELDLNKFNALTVWSERYEVNFTTAALRWTDSQEMQR